jgi:cell filamentation protein
LRFYHWAGQLRTVAIAKRDLFRLPQHIPSFAGDIFGRLARTDYLRGLNRAAFVDGLTDVLADTNALHPFREGNGRAQRASLVQLARSAGHRLSWQGLDQQANVRASRAAHRGDNQPLRALMDRLVDRDQPSSPHSTPGEGEGEAANPRIPAQPSPRRHSPRRKPPGESP